MDVIYGWSPQGVSEGDFVDVVDIAEEEVEEISEVVTNVQSQAVQIRSDLLKENDKPSAVEYVMESAKSPDEISVMSSPKRKRSAAEALVPLQKPLAASRPLEPTRSVEDTSETVTSMVNLEQSRPVEPVEPLEPTKSVETSSPLVPLEPSVPPATKKFRLSLRPGSEGVEHLDFDSFFLEQFLLSPVSVAIEQCSAVIRAEGPAPDFEEVCDQTDEGSGELLAG